MLIMSIYDAPVVVLNLPACTGIFGLVIRVVA